MNKKIGSIKSLIIKVISLLLIVLFFVPLFTVSCQGQKYTFSAANLTKGFKYSEYFGKTQAEPNIICSLLIIIPIIILMVSFIVKNKKKLYLINSICGIIDIIILIAIIIKVRSNIKNRFISFVEFKVNIGFYLTLLLNLFIICLSIFELAGIARKNPILQNMSDTNLERICTNCGAQLQANYAYCVECGVKYEESNINNITNKFCINCGKILHADDKFCTNCGSKVE